MTLLFDRIAALLPRLLSGMAVNFEIAVVAMGLGLALGIPLAGARLYGGFLGAAAGMLTALMRAAPTFVVMFFLLNAVPQQLHLFGAGFALSGLMTVALALLPYAAAYVCDNGVEAMRQLARGSHLGGLLFLPNLMRAFFVLVMSSSTGAAIGVNEGISVILHAAEQLPSTGEKLVLFLLGVLFFGVPLQLSFALMGRLQRRLGALAARRGAAAYSRL